MAAGQLDRRRLYELSAELVELDAAMADPGIVGDGKYDPEGDETLRMLRGFFEARRAELGEVAGGLWYLVESLQGDIDFYKRELARIGNLRAALEARQEGIKANLLAWFVENKVTEIPGKPYSVLLKGNGGLAPLLLDPDFTPADVPAEFQKVDFDNKAIRAALDAGRTLPFAKEGERGKHLEGRKAAG